MLEAYGDIWREQHKYDAIVVTTNGFVKKNGEAVMGRGIALGAKTKYPDLPKYLGGILKQYGNIPWIFSIDQWNGEEAYEDVIFTLPVKPEFGPNGEPGWRARADINLIKRSVKKLVAMVDDLGYMKKVLMPRPGCGNGGLKWEDVKPIIEPLLDDRFTVMERLDYNAKPYGNGLTFKAL